MYKIQIAKQFIIWVKRCLEHEKKKKKKTFPPPGHTHTLWNYFNCSLFTQPFSLQKNMSPLLHGLRCLCEHFPFLSIQAQACRWRCNSEETCNGNCSLSNSSLHQDHAPQSPPKAISDISSHPSVKDLSKIIRIHGYKQVAYNQIGGATWQSNSPALLP